MKTKTNQKFRYPFQLLLLVCLLNVTNLSFAGEKVELISAETFTINSSALNEERTMSVYLPGTYNDGSNEFPVLYLLDGRAHFTHAFS